MAIWDLYWKIHMLILTAQADSNFTFILLELILADQLADLPPNSGI